VDGDRPGAQKVSQRFKVTGYPTMVLFKPRRPARSRACPARSSPQRMMAVLQQGLSGGRAAQAVLADAALAAKPLTPNDWRMLAFYSWETSEAATGAQETRWPTPWCSWPPPPAKTADADTHTRLWLKAVAASDAGQGVAPDAALRERVLKCAGRPAAGACADGRAEQLRHDIVRTLTPEGEPAADRARLLAACRRALLKLEADASLSRADRLSRAAGACGAGAHRPAQARRCR
jgi:hypothetical protein